MVKRPLLSATITSLEELERVHLNRGPLYATPKFDGIRALLIDSRPLTRNFKPIRSVVVARKMVEHVETGADGELIIPGGTFQQSTSAVMSADEYDLAERVKYMIFDSTLYPDEPYLTRLDLLRLQSQAYTLPEFWEIVFPTEIKTISELKSYEEFVLNQGYEGVMLRTNARYKEGRSTFREGILMKLKQFFDSEAEVLAIEQYFSNQNELDQDEFGLAKRSKSQEGMVPLELAGAFVVRDLVSGKTFKVASGLTQMEREVIWKNRESYVGKIIKYKYQRIGMLDLPRFPVYLGIRED